MTTWDISKPLGSEAVSQMDDRIRETRAGIQEALRAQGSEGDEAVFPGSDSDNPVFRPRLPIGAEASRPSASADAGLYINTTKNTIDRCDDSAWTQVATLIPSGTKMAFFQASVPTGWTQDTDNNDKTLRVVSGTGGGTGGTHSLSSPPSTSHTHTISSANIDHKHKTTATYNATTTGRTVVIGNVFGLSGNANGQSGATFGGTAADTSDDEYQLTDTMESNASHDHGGATASGGPTAFAPAYIDVVVGSKD